MMKGTLNIISLVLALITAGVCALTYSFNMPQVLVVGLAVVGLFVALSPRVIQDWERGVMLRLGKFTAVLEPGVNWVIPGLDSIARQVDMRIRSTSFSAEKTLTEDTVPVNVDAVLFWVVTDARRAVLEVETYEQTVRWAAQTTLRDVIGKSELVRMISDREALDVELQKIIDAKTSEWGVTVQSVEIRDVRLPAGLEDAMSRKAQADREKEARVILAEAELQIAEQMKEAADIYEIHPAAMQLRAMNMTYEAVKEKGALMVLPSSIADSMNSTAIAGLAGSAFENHSPVEGAA